MKNRKLIRRWIDVELRSILNVKEVDEKYMEYFVDKYIESKYTNHKTWFEDCFYIVFDSDEFQNILNGDLK